MNKCNRSVRGLVLLQSLKNGTLPKQLKARVIGQHQYLLGGKKAVNVQVLELSREELQEAFFTLADSLLRKHYYAHFVDGDKLYIVYPDCVCKIRRNDLDSEQRCQRIGRMFGIPDRQMRFNDLFLKDHPNESKP